MSITASELTSRVSTLQKFWTVRNRRMQEWYAQIQMIDNNAKKDMESFVGNDPRSAFNLITSILNQPIPHRLDSLELTEELMKPAGEMSTLLETIWKNIFMWYRQRGRKWMEDFIKYMLSTGWTAAFATISVDGVACYAEPWNPATVYPAWDDMLVECAHITTITKLQAERLAMRNGWSELSRLSDKNSLQDYWWVETTQNIPVIHNAIVLGNELVKQDTIETRFHRIPIFISPVAGLPDNGELVAGRNQERWKGEIGQGLPATNENIYSAFNKWWSFMLQILKDTAIPRTFERTSSTNQIVKPENWFRRGAHYKLGLQDEIGYLTPPAIPVELRSTQLDMEAMMQRGGPSWSMYGAGNQNLTTYLMSQITATTNNVAKDYHNGVIDTMTDIDNFFLELVRENNYKPYGLGYPSKLPDDARATASYELRIPGDLVQRATTSRMLSPTFELSHDRIMDYSFPEIKNTAEERAKVRADKAEQNPIFSQLTLIDALKQEAAILREAKNIPAATLYEKAASILETQITGAGQQQQQSQTGSTTSVRPGPETVAPNESTPVM
ncbi:MAG: hypothetical protein M0R06_00235 [Sphaerochaeta sp.]|jgi:hypothetical protein|nr:hypothetical protein [Sphaerochaeta sp.]